MLLGEPAQLGMRQHNRRGDEQGDPLYASRRENWRGPGQFGAHRFGGVCSYRRIAGSVRLSLHAYGAVIDIDPKNNPLGRA